MTVGEKEYIQGNFAPPSAQEYSSIFDSEYSEKFNCIQSLNYEWPLEVSVEEVIPFHERYVHQLSVRLLERSSSAVSMDATTSGFVLNSMPREYKYDREEKRTELNSS